MDWKYLDIFILNMLFFKYTCIIKISKYFSVVILYIISTMRSLKAKIFLVLKDYPRKDTNIAHPNNFSLLLGTTNPRFLHKK